jgi:hypothetical protein
MFDGPHQGVAVGTVFGRRDRGWNAVSPSTRYRATNLDTHPGQTQYARATSAWDRPSTTTAVITNRTRDMPESQARDLSYALRHAVPIS